MVSRNQVTQPQKNENSKCQKTARDGKSGSTIKATSLAVGGRSGGCSQKALGARLRGKARMSGHLSVGVSYL